MRTTQITVPLSESERDFAAQNHYLVINFMKRNELDMDEYYDVLIFRYLRAVKRYLEEREQTMDFVSTVNKTLGLALRDCIKKQYRQEQYERAASLDALISDGYTLLDLLANGEPDPCEELCGRQAEERLLSKLPDKLRNVLQMRADGYTNREIARSVGIPKNQVSNLMTEIRITIAL